MRQVKDVSPFRVDYTTGPAHLQNAVVHDKPAIVKRTGVADAHFVP